jgi:GR25 family glycosyltransferase involved in LPS biosynthesis
MKALKAFLKTKDKHCIVIEDDALIKKNFWEDTLKILKTLNTKDSEWDVSWLYNSGYCEYVAPNTFPEWRNAPLGSSFSNCHATPSLKKKYGIGGFKARNPLKVNAKFNIYKMTKPAIFDTLAYLISRKGAQKILARGLPIQSKPTDVMMQDFPSDEIHYTVKPAKVMKNKDGTVWFDSLLMEADKIANSTLLT